MSIPEQEKKFVPLQQEYGDLSTSIHKITLEELNVLKKELLSDKLWLELIDLIASNLMNLEQLRNDLKTKLYLCKNIKTLQLYNYTIIQNVFTI